MWLILRSEDFAHAAVTLREARNVKYADFVEPGEVLRVEAEILRQDAETSTVKAQGTVDGSVAVSGRLVLERFHLQERFPHQGELDPFTRRCMRDEFEQLCESSAVSS